MREIFLDHLGSFNLMLSHKNKSFAWLLSVGDVSMKGWSETCNLAMNMKWVGSWGTPGGKNQ